MKKHKIKKKHKTKDPLPIGVAIFFIIVGLFMGTVFTFGMQYWGSPLEREDAVEVSATYEKCWVQYGRHSSISQIVLSLNERDDLCIDGACANEKIIERIKELPKGAKLDMLVHPNSDTVWELRYGDEIILSFEESQKDIKGENIGFGILGLILYAGAAFGIGSLLARALRARKRSRKGR